MTDKSPIKQLKLTYIETPRAKCRPEKISQLLEKRMKDFLLERQRKKWREGKL